jgi:hypothetical protein
MLRRPSAFSAEWFVTAIAPITPARSTRMQSGVIKDGCHITLDDEWVTVAYPLQATTIPKTPMTGEQQVEFAAFVTRLPASIGRSPSRNRR